MLSDEYIHNIYLLLWSQLNDPEVTIPISIDEFTIPTRNTYPTVPSYATQSQVFAYAALMSGSTYVTNFTLVVDGTSITPITDSTTVIDNTSVTFVYISTFVSPLISWDFGDGTTSTSVSPTHIYSGPGLYFVTMHTQSFSVSHQILIT
jgi:PKD repeat protein